MSGSMCLRYIFWPSEISDCEKYVKKYRVNGATRALLYLNKLCRAIVPEVVRRFLSLVKRLAVSFLNFQVCNSAEKARQRVGGGGGGDRDESEATKSRP